MGLRNTLLEHYIPLFARVLFTNACGDKVPSRTIIRGLTSKCQIPSHKYQKCQLQFHEGRQGEGRRGDKDPRCKFQIPNSKFQDPKPLILLNREPVNHWALKHSTLNHLNIEPLNIEPLNIEPLNPWTLNPWTLNPWTLESYIFETWNLKLETWTERSELTEGKH
jgi:hypothetical protein